MKGAKYEKIGSNHFHAGSPATILPPLLFFVDQLSLAGTKAWMAGAMLLWYLSTPFWMKIRPTG